MQNIKSVSVELSNKIEEMINSKVKNETYLLVESLIILEELKELISKEHDQRTKNQLTQNTIEKIIYKKIEIELVNGFYIHFMNGHKCINTNIHMAKRMITRDLKK
jgi:hypothetical protein